MLSSVERQQRTVVDRPLCLVPGLLWMINGEFPHRTDAGGFAVETPHHLVVFDAGSGKNTPRVEANLDQLGGRARKIVHIATHNHLDHVGGVMPLVEHGYGSEVWTPESHLSSQPTGDATASDLYDVRFPGVRVDRTLYDNEVLQFGDVRIHVVSTPGHAPDHACYFISWRGNLIGIFGDIDGGHSERLGSDLEQRSRSIARLTDVREFTYVEGHGGLSQPLRPRFEFVQKMRRCGERLQPGFGYLFDPMHR